VETKTVNQEQSPDIQATRDATAEAAAPVLAPDPAPPAPIPQPVAEQASAQPGDARVLLHMPVDVRSVALIVISFVLVLAVLRWASAFFIPLMLGFMFSYALSPIVDALHRWRIPRALSAAVLILGMLFGAGASVYSFSDDASQLIDTLPEAARKLRDSIHLSARSPGASRLGTVQKAAAQLEQAAEEAGAPTAPSARGVQRVVVEKPRFDIREHLWNGTIGLASLIGQVVIVTFLTYFLLISGDTFRRKLVKIAGPSFASKKITVEAMDEITQQIQRYLFVQLLSSVAVGIVTALAFWGLGLNHPIVWGIAAAILNLIPYIGSAIVAGAAALVGFMQFGELRMAFALAAASLFIHTLSGNLMVPWLTSKTSRMNPVAVFVGVLAWGWLWGVWGLLLGIPILMAVKAVCDRIDDLKPIGELLGT
jgi:predicted PurR-regulated permease PerM